MIKKRSDEESIQPRKAVFLERLKAVLRSVGLKDVLTWK